MNDDFFAGISQPLSEYQRQTIMENVYDRLEAIVGDKLAEQLDDQKFEQFQAVIDEDNQEKLDAWIDQNIPGYQELVDSTLESLRQEVLASPESFL